MGAYYILGIVAATIALLQFVNGAFGLLPWMSAFHFRSANYEVGAGLTMGFRLRSRSSVSRAGPRVTTYHWIAIACGYWAFTRRPRHLAALVLFLFAFYVANSLLGYVLLGVFVFAFLLTQMWKRNMFSLSPRRKAALVALAYVGLLAWLWDSRCRCRNCSTDRFAVLVSSRKAEAARQPLGQHLRGTRGMATRASVRRWTGEYRRSYCPVLQGQGVHFRSYFGSDSLYVQILAETGVIGLVTFLYSGLV